MPELRSRARRNRAAVNPNPNPNPQPQDNTNSNNKRLTLRTRQQRRAAQNKNKANTIVAVDENNKSKNIVNAEGTTPLNEKEEGGLLKEEVAEKKMDEYDSGGRSGDKGPGAEDEGSTAPLPEKVNFFYGFCSLLVEMLIN